MLGLNELIEIEEIITIEAFLRFASFVQLKLDEILIFVRIRFEFLFPALTTIDSTVQIPRFCRWVVLCHCLKIELNRIL